MSVETFNEKQMLGYEAIKSGKNVYIGGLGGCGKSYLINTIREELGDRAVFVAPTGIAALNIKGMTIHSLFGLPLRVCTKSVRNNPSKKAFEIFEDDMIKTLVIDEISMVRADVFSAMDNHLRLIKRKNIPFGGIQVVTVGDFGQLSPVIKSYGHESKVFYEEFSSPYCFTTESWSSAGMYHVELDKVIRQNDETLINNLKKIHSKSSGYKESIEYFNQNCILSNKIKQGYDVDDIEDGSTFLTTTNKDAEEINQESYNDIEGEEFVFYANSYGGFRERPAPEKLKLKIGTKVMITANQIGGGYKNGEIGYVSDIGTGTISVMIDEDTTHYVEKFKWSEFEYIRNKNGGLSLVEKATYKQFPLKHGYAITIHKSQGCTLDKAIINIPNAFTHGQTYVALSRVKTLEGISLVQKLAPSDIIFDKDVKDFYAGKFNNLLT